MTILMPKSLNTGYVVLTIVVLFTLYLIVLGVYRVYFSPTSHIPGPTLAKLTYWYEFYYDVILTGQYVFKIKDLHAQYGPIIRVNPDEVHILDPDFYEVVNASSSKKLSRWKWQTDPFDIEDSVFAAIKAETHRVRRAPLNPFFSKAKVRGLQSRIDVVIEKFLGRVGGFQESGKPMRVDHAFVCLTNDIATEYAFGRSFNRVEDPEFDPFFQISCVANVVNCHIMRHLPWFCTMMTHYLPTRIAMFLNPGFASFLEFQREVKAQTREVQANHGKEKVNLTNETILHAVMNSNAPASEKRFSAMWQNGQTIIIAGTVTTAATLSTILVHLLEQPDKLRLLREELRDAMPDPEAPADLLAIEKLPYLYGVVNEGLRLGSGVSGRLPRIDPEHPTIFYDRFKHQGKQYTIPPGTPMSMTSMHTHYNPSIYPEPNNFNPQRWIGPEAPSEKYLAPFSKGARACLGINLAYAELYLTLAYLFRRYGSEETRMDGDSGVLELFETTHDDVRIVADCNVPLWPESSKGVFVVVRK